MTTRYRTSFYRFLPSWLTRDEGERVGYSLMLLLDAFLTRLYQGLVARFPEYAPDDDALGALGKDRKIVRGIGEPAANYAARLIRFLDDHRRRGNDFALMDQLAAYVQVELVQRSVDHKTNWYTRATDGSESYLLQAGNWDWDGTPANQWAVYWPILYPPTELWEPDGVWGVADGQQWGDTDGTWGSTATLEEVQTVRAIVKTWGAEHARASHILIAFDSAVFDPTDTSPPLPDGTWGDWSKNVGGVQVPARDEDAIYWDGVPRAA